MSVQPVPWPEPDPAVAAAVRAIWGSRKSEPPLAVTVRDRLGEWLHDEAFAAAFGVRERPGWSPSRLALVTVLQRAENLTDRMAAARSQPSADRPPLSWCWSRRSCSSCCCSPSPPAAWSRPGSTSTARPSRPPAPHPSPVPPAAASAQATSVAQAALAGQSVSCNPAVITPDTADFVPGGEVTVQVSCTVHLSDLSLLHVPGTETIASTFTSPIDTYRGEIGGLANAEGLPTLNPRAVSL